MTASKKEVQNTYSQYVANQKHVNQDIHLGKISVGIWAILGSFEIEFEQTKLFCIQPNLIDLYIYYAGCQHKFVLYSTPCRM